MAVVWDSHGVLLGCMLGGWYIASRYNTTRTQQTTEHRGYHPCWLLLLSAIAIGVEQRRYRRAIMAAAAQAQTEKKATHEPENCEWLNNLLAKLMLQMNDRLVDTTEAKLKDILTHDLAASKPSSVESIQVEHISFGQAAPALRNLVATQKNNDLVCL